MRGRRTIGWCVDAALGAWSGGKWLLDYYGRAVAVEDFTNPESLLARAAIWLFSTPAWVPGIGALLLTVALIWWIKPKQIPPQIVAPNYVDARTSELAGIVNAMRERALDWRFRLPLLDGDPFKGQYEQIELSQHPIWTDSTTNQLRRDFLNRCGRIGYQHETSPDANEIRELRSDLQEIGQKLINGLLGQR